VALLLDSTVVIDVLRGSMRTGARLRELGDVPLVSAITVDEVLFGVREADEPALDALLDWVEIVPVGVREARIASRWRREYRVKGVMLHQADALVAACAFTHRTALATADVRRFPQAELPVEHWPRDG